MPTDYHFIKADLKQAQAQKAVLEKRVKKLIDAGDDLHIALEHHNPNSPALKAWDDLTEKP